VPVPKKAGPWAGFVSVRDATVSYQLNTRCPHAMLLTKAGNRNLIQ
jgi:hypothetical protein